MVQRLKEGRTVQSLGAMVFFLSLPGLLRPVWATIADRRSARGRRHNLLLTAGAILFAAACAVAPRGEGAVGSSLVLGLGEALVTASLMGIVVAVGRATRLEGPLSAAQVLLPVLALLVWPACQDLADGSLAAIMGGAGALVLTVAALAWPGWASPPLSSPALAAGDAPTFRQILKTRALWMTALVVVLVQTGLFELPVRLTFSKILSAELHERASRFEVWGLVGGALIYGLASRALPLRRLLPAAILLGTITEVVFVSSLTADSAVLACVISGLGHALIHCAILHLMMRAAPVGHEALVIALLSGARAIAHGLVVAVSLNFVGPASFSAAPVVAIVLGAAGLLATRFVPREVVDPRG